MYTLKTEFLCIDSILLKRIMSVSFKHIVSVSLAHLHTAFR